ncbi:HIPL1 protein-like protein [Drosera capensis]
MEAKKTEQEEQRQESPTTSTNTPKSPAAANRLRCGRNQELLRESANSYRGRETRSRNENRGGEVKAKISLDFLESKLYSSEKSNFLSGAMEAADLSPKSIEYAHFLAKLMFDEAEREIEERFVNAVKECQRGLSVEDPIDPRTEKTRSYDLEGSIDRLFSSSSSGEETAEIVDEGDDYSTELQNVGGMSSFRNSLRHIKVFRHELLKTPLQDHTHVLGCVFCPLPRVMIGLGNASVSKRNEPVASTSLRSALKHSFSELDKNKSCKSCKQSVDVIVAEFSLLVSANDLRTAKERHRLSSFSELLYSIEIQSESYCHCGGQNAFHHTTSNVPEVVTAALVWFEQEKFTDDVIPTTLAALSTEIHIGVIYPSLNVNISHGLVSMGFLGLSPAILVQFYQTIYGNNPTSFILMASLVSTICPLCLMWFIRNDTSSEPYDGQHLNNFSLILVIIAAYLVVVTVLQSFISLQLNARIIVSLILLFLLASPLFYMFRILHENPGETPEITFAGSDGCEGGSAKTYYELPNQSDDEVVDEATDEGPNINLMQAICSANFWLLFVSLTCSFGSGLALINNLAQVSESLGYLSSETSTFISLWGIWNSLGRFLGGSLSDYTQRVKGWSRPFFMTITVCIFSIGHGIMAASGFPGMLHVGSIITGLCTGSQMSIAPAIISEIFGLVDMGTIYNSIMLAGSLGSYIFSIIFGYLYDKEQSRQLGNACVGSRCFISSFLIMAAANLLGSVVSMILHLRTKRFYQRIMGLFMWIKGKARSFGFWVSENLVMGSTNPIIFLSIFLLLVLLGHDVLCLPLCVDSSAPFTVKSPLNFCSYSGSVCCNATEDGQLEKLYQSMNISNAACAAIVKSVLCATDFCNAFGGASQDGSLCYDGKPVTFNSFGTPSSPSGLCLEKIGNGSYLDMAAHPDGSNRAFFANQLGKIWLTTIPKQESGGVLELDESSPFLDITDEVHFDPEFGLLGVAMHPKFTENGHFFVSFNCDKVKWPACSGRCSCNSDVNCDPAQLPYDNGASPCQYNSVVSEYTVNGTASEPSSAKSANPAEVKRIFTMGLPFTAHHSGQLLFGPHDGYLYFMMGDGGGTDDPYNFAQNKKSLLGKIMRLDIDTIPSATEESVLGLWGNYSIQDNPHSEDRGLEPEIWALGLRNPWRCSFDAERPSYFLCADVGQNGYEEVNVITKGGNYGWRVYEGYHLYAPPKAPGGNTSASSINPIFPVMGYNHSAVNQKEESASITGGFFYQSSTDPCMTGRYLYADLYGGNIWSGIEFPVDSGNFTTAALNFSCAPDSPIDCGSIPGTPLPALGYVFSFGQDNDKDIYLLASSGVYRVVPPSRCNYTCSKENVTAFSKPEGSSPSGTNRFNRQHSGRLFFLLSFLVLFITIYV